MEFVALCAILWIVFHFGAGYLAYRLSLGRLAGLPFVSRSYDWELSGRVYRRLGIRWWKDRLPEAGAFYRGGFSKRHLQCNDADYLGRFLLETARAEFSHWLTWALALTFFLWTPRPVGVAMLGYGAVVNVPCILVQRYNRVRLKRALETSERLAHRDRAALPGHAVAHQGEIE